MSDDPPTPKLQDLDHRRRDRLEQLEALEAVFDQLGALDSVFDEAPSRPGKQKKKVHIGTVEAIEEWSRSSPGATGRLSTFSPPKAAAAPSPSGTGKKPPAAAAKRPLPGGGGGGVPQSADGEGCTEKTNLPPRQQEVRETIRSAEERPHWRPQQAPKDRPGWNARHKMTYSNTNLNPNVRSYFDRWLDVRSPDVDTRLGPLKPGWRLDPQGVPQEEREATEDALRNFSPQGPRRSGGTARSPARKQRAPPGTQPHRPWEHPPEPLPDDHELCLPKPGGGGSGSAAASCAAAKSAAMAADEESGAKFFEEVGDWDVRHAVLWCNEQKVGDYTRLNPPQFRSYFDRWRDPDTGARSQTLRRRASDGNEEVSRVIPVWRLEPVPGSPQLPSPEELKVRHSPMAARTGTGGDPKMVEKGQSISRSLSTPSSSSLRPSAGPGMAKREKRWNARHDLTFKNEEMSRLDRSYFDRHREPLCLLGPDSEKQALGSVRIWSLERSGNPAEEAAIVAEAGDKRFGPDGKWNDRHHVTFYNRIHPNARSYFERQREPPSLAAAADKLVMADPNELTGPQYADPTAAMERRQREKLREDERLPVQWSLQEPAGPRDRFALQDSLRRCDSEPDAKVAKRKERRRSAWFSSHGVVF